MTHCLWKDSKSRKTNLIQWNRHFSIPLIVFDSSALRHIETMEPKLISTKFYQILHLGSYYPTQIVKNFVYLSITEPEIFPEQLEIDQAASKIPQSTYQFI